MPVSVPKDKVPLNVDLLRVDRSQLSNLKEVKEIMTFNNEGIFHPEGLFSNQIFGIIGTEARNRTFGFIDLKTEYLHPIVYYAIIKLKALYKNIIESRTTAVFDKKTKTFIKSNSEEAETGFTFFMKYFNELNFQETGSPRNHYYIRLIEKARKEDKALMRYLLVLPAGLRDYTVDKYGKPQEDEVNAYYRRILSQTSVVDPKLAKLQPDSYDEVYSNVQNTLLDIVEYFKSLMDGKNKLILGKWLTRKTFNSTRNVATSAVEKATSIKEPTRIKPNETQVGLHQFLRLCMPRSAYLVKTKYLHQVFMENSPVAHLVNAKTLKQEQVDTLKVQKDIESWTSQDGLEKHFANFGNLNIRDNPVMTSDKKYYFGLIYQDDKYFKFFQDIDELPENYSKDNVRPITFAELLYMSVYELSGYIPGFVTRYPVIEYGSIYPTIIKMKTTIEDLQLEELDDNWQPSGKIATSFPVKGRDYFNTTAVHPTHIARLGLDFDGDTISVQAVLTEEAIDELYKKFKSRDFYITPDNKMNFTISSATLNPILKYMTA